MVPYRTILTRLFTPLYGMSAAPQAKVQVEEEEEEEEEEERPRAKSPLSLFGFGAKPVSHRRQAVYQ